MSFFFLKSKFTKEHYKRACKKAGVDALKTVYIFPGNPAYHNTAASTLYSIKPSGRMSDIPRELGEIGVPTLSLPIAGMKEIKSEADLPPVVTQAIVNLWKAAGYGYHFALSTRKQISTHYFNSLISAKQESLEPNFWGERDTLVSNKILAQYYLKHLAELKLYCNMQKPAEQVKMRKALPKALRVAYREGREAEKNGLAAPAWYSGQHEDDALTQTKERICAELDKYISSWKFSFTCFGHHHNRRAKLAKIAIMNADSFTTLDNILTNQKAQFENKKIEPTADMKSMLGIEFSASLKNRPKDCSTSGYFNAIEKSIDISNGFAVLKETVCKSLDIYIAWWKPRFYHHHDGRARIVRNALAKAETYEDVCLIIHNQLALFDSEKGSLDFEGLDHYVKDSLGKRYATMVTNFPVAYKDNNVQKKNNRGGYYKALYDAKEEMNDWLERHDKIYSV